MADDNPNPNPGAPPKDPPPAPGLPKTPGDVKRTPLKHPQIIALEKKVSEQEDEIAGLKDQVSGVMDFLEDAGIGGPKEVKVKHKQPPVPDPVPGPNGGGMFDEINRMLWGGKN